MKTETLRLKPQTCVYVKGIGAAKILDIVEDTYFMLFYTGKSGQGWKDRDVEKTITPKMFWSEWNRAKGFR